MNILNILNYLKKYDFTFFGIATVIFIFGVTNLYSATHTSSSLFITGLYKTQIIYFIFSIFVGVVVSFIKPQNIFQYTWPVYAFNILLLILVLFMGHKGMGAQRWIILGSVRLQPSELMKISIILVLARIYAKSHPERELDLWGMIIPLIVTAIPTGLIVIEPDLGTGLIVILIFLSVSFYRRLSWRTIAILTVVGMISGVVTYKFFLKPYQQRRVSAFLNPGSDVKGAGYNAIQSKIAIGAGRFFGKGFKKSSQASLNYLPENHTDFVFSIYNEEQGFFGSIILISLYFILLYRFIYLATAVTRLFDSIVVIGIMSIFFWHIVINMGMVTGLLPVVGLPLPLMSYGGSSLLTFGICCGIATSISNSRNLF